MLPCCRISADPEGLHGVYQAGQISPAHEQRRARAPLRAVYMEYIIPCDVEYCIQYYNIDNKNDIMMVASTLAYITGEMLP